MRIIGLCLFLFPMAGLAQAPGGSEICAGCHGARGEGDPVNGYPRIAGQPREYLQRQLEAYVDGRRSNPVMEPIAKQLKPDQRANLALYYSQLNPPPKKPPAHAGNTKRGLTLATVGDESLHVQACQNCHGPGGTGLANLNPYLTGLNGRYLEAALREWKDGTRKTDPSLQMTLIGKNLTDADMKGLAAYFASQPPPPPTTVAQKPAAAKAPSERTRAGTATQPRQGGGVTGSEPRPAGTQGPGGGGTR
jgi:cytochrome c553